MINGRTLGSLRETQVEQGRRLDEHDRRFDDLDHQLGEVRHGMDTIVGMLTTLIERDERNRGDR